jgi:thioredoxin reductase (NADPH)
MQLSDANDQLRTIPADVVLARQGLSPKLGPLANWGLALERKQIPVDTARFATTVPGVYAIGDVNTYPGKRKLIACGFHEAVLAGFDAASVLAGSPVPLEYTTSSAKLQQRLGLGSTAP